MSEAAWTNLSGCSNLNSILQEVRARLKRIRCTRLKQSSTGSTNSKERHGSITTDSFVDGSIWQAVPWKNWVQRFMFRDVAWILQCFAWNDVGRLVGRCSNFRLLVVVVQICFRRAEVIWRPWCTGNDLCNFCTIAHDTREVAFQYQRIFWPNERYPRWRKNQVKCWGWVVQPCSWCYEHFWSPCHQGNDPCNFCGIQHATSEVTFQYQRIFGRSMDDTPRWTTKTVQYAGLWRSCEGLGSIFGLEFRIILLMQQMYRLDCRLRSSNVLHRMRPVQGLRGKHRHCKVRVMPECSKNKCGKSVPCSNNKNGSWIVARSTTNMV